MSVLVPETARDVPLYALMCAGGAVAGWLAWKSNAGTVAGGAIGLIGVYLYERHLAEQAAIEQARQAALAAATRFEEAPHGG